MRSILTSSTQLPSGFMPPSKWADRPARSSPRSHTTRPTGASFSRLRQNWRLPHAGAARRRLSLHKASNRHLPSSWPHLYCRAVCRLCADPHRSQPWTWPPALPLRRPTHNTVSSRNADAVIRLKCSAPEHSWRGVRKCSEILRQPTSSTRFESRRTTLPHNRLQLFTGFNIAATSDHWSPPILEHNPSDETAVMVRGATQYARRRFPHGRGFGP